MGHWSKKGTFCGCKIVNFNISTIKILGVHFSFNEQLAENRNFVETVKLKRYLEFGLREVYSIWQNSIFQSISIVQNRVCC